MRLDAEIVRYMTKQEFRVLTAVEMGHKNHEFVPAPLVESIAALKRHSIRGVLATLCKNKLLHRTNHKYEGFKLTYLGYDFLALHALVKRGLISGVGSRMGVGKESDIHLCQNSEGKILVLKLHRLGRISFRSIKRNRDYLQHRQHASWMYLARLAALKEFSYLKALYTHHFPVPQPVDVNRHAVLMEHIDAIPFREVRELAHPSRVLEKLMQLIVRLAKSGLIHGDFNEFNLMIDDSEHITVIDLPQVVSIHHPNARAYFERDVECIKKLFERKFGIDVVLAPSFDTVMEEMASGADGKATTSTEDLTTTISDVLKSNELHALDDALDALRRQRDSGESGEERGAEDTPESEIGSETGVSPDEDGSRPAEELSEEDEEDSEAQEGSSSNEEVAGENLKADDASESDEDSSGPPSEGEQQMIPCYRPKLRR
ncbi:rio1 family protein [Cystoisospora suis]|uniref:Serine/threonine-protein kinase RIO2 n=1 Tax=Cystoisospora suis TaxID=483139 RepID=A0A2C6L8A1_9APIC|nr:rio1 family protein [Cystoisospora suis]